MTGTKISQYPSTSTPPTSFEVLGTDPTDTTEGPSGTTKTTPLSAILAMGGGGGGGGGSGLVGWKDLVGTYGADPTGVTPASTALASACTAAVAAQPASFGLTVPPGTFTLTAPQDLPWNMIMQGAGAEDGATLGEYTGTLFNVGSGFSGAYVFGFKDSASHNITNGCVVRDIMLNGAAYSAAAVNGFYIYGPVPCTFRDIIIVNMSGWGISTAWDSSSTTQVSPFAQSWRGISVVNSGILAGGGIQLVGCEDSVFTECYSIGNGTGPGFHIEQCDNSKFVACNAEFNATYGYYVTGDWTYFNGGCVLTGISSDRNGQYGFYCDATWTAGQGAGTGPGVIQVGDCHFRRDGQANPAQSAGFALGATTVPVILSGFSTYPGVDDGGGGSMAPAFGLYFSQSTYAQPVLVSNGLAWGNTACYRTSTTNSVLPTLTAGAAPNILKAHGPSYSPTYGS